MSNVIACIDDTEVSTAVCDCAVWASLQMNLPLEFLHVLRKPEKPTETDLSGNIGLDSRKNLLDELANLDEKREKLAQEHGRLMLKDAKKRAIANGVSDPISLQRHGGLIDTLTEMEDRISLLILGKHNEHLNEHVGSRLESVIRSMQQPTLITPSNFIVPTQVMLAFDGSHTTRKGVEMIAARPLFQGIPCHIVMVGEKSNKNIKQLNWAKETLEKADFETSASIINGDVERVLCDYRASNNIDMLVMGAYGHSAIRRFFVGSTTTSVIRDASVPVLLLR